ncbi:MAG: hypothetical protein WCF04_01000, partial [Candidatus Nanopelagicales bacterium]
QRFGAYVSPIFATVGRVARGFFDVLKSGDPSALAEALNIGTDSPLIGFLQDAREGVVALAGMARDLFASLRGDGKGTSTFEMIAGYVTGTLIPTLSQVGTTIVRVFTSPQAQSFAKMLLSVLGQVAGFVTGTLVPIVVRIYGILITYLVPAFNQVAGFIQTRLLPALTSFGGYLQTEIIPRVTSMVQTFANNLMPVIRSIAEFLSTRVVPALTSLGGAILDAVDSAKPFITYLVRGISLSVGWASKILGVLVPVLLKLAGPVLGALISVIGGTIRAIGSVLGWLGRFGNAVLDAGRAVAEMGKAIGRHIGDVVAWFKALPGKITRGVGNMGRTLYKKGRDLVQGFLNGAGSLLPKIGSFFLDKLPGWIRGPFKQALGISSPSTLFAGYGQNIGQGLIDGLKRQVAGVRAATVDITDAATPGAADFQAAHAAKLARQLRGGRLEIATPGGAAGGGMVVNITNNYPKPERASDSIAMSLRRAQYAMGG